MSAREQSVRVTRPATWWQVYAAVVGQIAGKSIYWEDGEAHGVPSYDELELAKRIADEAVSVAELP